ncbi:dynamin family protein [Candidatus Viridilinea mediisalina]|uniref:Dynamin n=1 Tax=Candidatus Viridilinea mediisalina TaxID=2024553 RepID=A0A2A6RMC4_9CHLR|nr:dynamin family protein [Candidatus Viridilinea mediisalina]PDW04010.1 dynamin [Candidatus Viridilinea mediisalina]
MGFLEGLLQRKGLITERQDALLAELRTVLEQLLVAFERFGADVDPADQRTVQDTLDHLEELFLIVIAGEFNSGKSSFVNALLGEQVLPEGVTPTTDAITLLSHGDEVASELRSSGLRVTTFPADVLRQLTIVDTPGTNAVIRHHEQLTREFIPRADLVLFATSADRPFTESERGFLELIKEWGKKITIILNKVDILNEQEREQVVTFIREHARTLLGVTPDIFPVSARLATRARQSEGAERERLWEASLFGAVEHYVVDTLDEETRVRLKLLSPLGVARRLSGKYMGVTQARLETLREDLTTMDNVDQQLEMFKADLNNDVKYYLGEIDEILQKFHNRGDAFFEEHIRLGRLRDLMKGEQFRALFEKEVVGDLNEQIDDKVQALIDWLVEKNLRLQQSIDEYIKRRASQHSERLIGAVGGSFDYNRRALLDSLGRTASDVVASYDKQRESAALAEEVRASLAATAITHVGAVGLGATIVTLAHAVWLDFTGILAATAIAIGGFALLPAKKRQAKRTLRTRVDELREQLRQGIEGQIEREVERSIGQIRERNAPFTRFVRAQRGQLSELQQRFADLDTSLGRLQKEIEG